MEESKREIKRESCEVRKSRIVENSETNVFHQQSFNLLFSSIIIHIHVNHYCDIFKLAYYLIHFNYRYIKLYFLNQYFKFKIHFTSTYSTKRQLFCSCGFRVFVCPRGTLTPRISCTYMLAQNKGYSNITQKDKKYRKQTFYFYSLY